jgi:hypothetical protein
LNEEMGFNGGIIANGIGTPEAHSINGEGRYQELLDLARRSIPVGEHPQFRRLSLLVPFRRRLLGLFVFSISITGVAILASVIFIPFAPTQQKTIFITRIAWSIIGLFAVCIISYGLLIWNSLQFPKRSR